MMVQSHSGMSTKEHRRNASKNAPLPPPPPIAITDPASNLGSAPSSPTPKTFDDLAAKAVHSAVKNTPSSQLDQYPDQVDDYEDADEAERKRLAQLWAGANVPTKPYRHIYIDLPNQTIKKTLAIGVSAENPYPPIYDRPLPEVEEDNAASCMLVTKNSPINATVYIIKGVRDKGDKSLGKPVHVSAKTGTASINLSVPEYQGSRPLHIRVKANNGNLTVTLPQTFAGLLTWRTETGTLRLSDAVRQRYKMLDDRVHKHRGTAKIQPSTATGNRGDACEIVNKHGSITILEAGEGKKSSESCLIV